MSHRIETGRGDGGSVTIRLEGVVDAVAVGELRVAIEAAAARGTRARILVRAGTVVERPMIAALRSLGAEIVAESPYLARWLASSPDRSDP